MTADQLAKQLGISRPWLFKIKQQFPSECPKNFDDLHSWQTFLAYTRTQAKVRGVKSTKAPLELSDIARLTKARANKVETEHEILSIELEATKRQVIRQEEVIALFAKVATIVRGRLAKMRSDLPSALMGLDPPAIDKLLGEKMEEALAFLSIPEDFFDTRGRV